MASTRMPPWNADPKVGHFKNARGLSAEQIKLLADWLKAGAPQGNPEQPPPRLSWKTDLGLGKRHIMLGSTGDDEPTLADVKPFYDAHWRFFEGKDKQIYNDGLIGLLRDIHDRIDAAVAEAYGWPESLSENDILMSLVALNHERAEEEARGHVRWLRPDYQNPDGRAAEVKTGRFEIAAAAKSGKAPWPKALPDQIAAVREALEDLGEADAETVARTFLRGRAKSVEPLLETLAGLGMAEMTDEGRYAI